MYYCFVVQILLNMFRALQCPSSGARQTAVAASGVRMNVDVEVVSAVVSPLTNRPRLRTLPPPHSYGNLRLQRHFDRLLMMGIVMPETCWAVPVRQGNNTFYDWLLHLVGCFIRVRAIHCILVSYHLGYLLIAPGRIPWSCPVANRALAVFRLWPFMSDMEEKVKQSCSSLTSQWLLSVSHTDVIRVSVTFKITCLGYFEK
jgi:hypothetical protein